jgi:RNA polymerase sigma-70 factor (ECF subfamily)
MRTANVSYTPLGPAVTDRATRRINPADAASAPYPVSGDEHLSSAELFRLHAPFVAKFILRMGAPRADLDDLMQEVFLIAHRNGGYQAGPAKPTTYLASIAFRLVHTERRKRRVRAFVESDTDQVDAAAGAGNPEHSALERERLRRLQKALDTLDEDKRAVFVLAELQGESVVSIAAGLGIPVDTAYSRLRAARKLFREAVHAQIEPATPTPPARLTPVTR